MRGLIGKTIENGFDFSAVPAGKGKLEKISLEEIFELIPATVAKSKIVF